MHLEFFANVAFKVSLQHISVPNLAVHYTACVLKPELDHLFFPTEIQDQRMKLAPLLQSFRRSIHDPCLQNEVIAPSAGSASAQPSPVS